MDPDQLTRRVADHTQNDAGLIDATAVDIARALNLEGNNRTLGRKYVRMAVASASLGEFRDMSKEYASLPESLQEKIYKEVKKKLESVKNMMSERVRERGEGGEGEGSESFSGFSGKMDSLGRGDSVVKGGLVRGKHVYSRPEGVSGGASGGVREKKTSALGLDKLAKLKQVSMAAARAEEEHDDEYEDHRDRGREGGSERARGRRSDDEDDERDTTKGTTCYIIYIHTVHIPCLGSSFYSLLMALYLVYVGRQGNRHYRSKVEPDTPSHGGGVNQARLEHINRRTDRHAKDRGRDRDRDRDRYDRDRRDRDRDRDRSDRDRDRDSDSDRHGSSRRGDNEWRKRDRDNDRDIGSRDAPRDKYDDRRGSDYNDKRGRYNSDSRRGTDRHDEHTNYNGNSRGGGSGKSGNMGPPSSRGGRQEKSSVRSGIGLNSDDWEAPERLSSNQNRGKMDPPDGEWSRPTPLRNSKGGATPSVFAMSSAGKAEMKSDVMSGSSRGFVGDDDVEEEIFSSGRGGRKAHVYDSDGSDDDFERDFYLADEGQSVMIDGNGAIEDDTFLGNSSKFKQREAEMAKKRALGDTKMAGMSARRSQLHADQEAWESNRLLQSGVAMEREVRFVCRRID